MSLKFLAMFMMVLTFFTGKAPAAGRILERFSIQASAISPSAPSAQQRFTVYMFFLGVPMALLLTTGSMFFGYLHSQ
eukprot:gene6043-5912_t